MMPMSPKPETTKPGATLKPDSMPALEWQSLLQIGVIYAAWLALTWFQANIPTWVLLPAGAIVIAGHGSFQHETIHGHPTKFASINWALAFPPIALWLPYQSYLRSHLAHHKSAVTDPLDDPESNYFSQPQWERLGVVGRFLAKANATLLGRMIIGPVWSIGSFLMQEGQEVLRGDVTRRRIWVVHLAGVCIVLAWVLLACHMSLARYILCFVYPGTSLALVRSFAEHRAADEPGNRTAIVEGGRFWELLFLNNNLHVVHHVHPSLPWYHLPAVYRQNREAYLCLNGGLVYRSYGDIFARYFLRPHDRLIHPGHRIASDTAHGSSQEKTED